MRRGWRAVFLLAATACALRPSARPPGDPDLGVDVRWWGHSCFSIRDSAGRVFLLDPFDDTVGYPPPRVKPDAVLITHDHFDHNAVPRVPVSVPVPGGSSAAPDGGDAGPEHERPAPGRPSSVVPFPVVLTTGTVTAAGIEVTGFLADHDDQGGRRNGTTRVYVWEMGGLRWAHLGDIGQKALRPDQKEALAGVDVLFIPVGGRTTVDAAGAAGLVREIGPRIVLPMHFGTPRTRFFEFDPVTPFLSFFERVNRLPPGSFHLRKADLPPDTTVYVPALPDDAKVKETP